MSDVKKAIVYCDIASFLDLRQGYLTTVADTFGNLSDYLFSDEYNERNLDVFPYGEVGGYEKALKSGDKRLLEGSTITYNVGIVSSRLRDNEMRDKFTGERSVAELWLNVYPFQFTEEESNHIRELVFLKTGRSNVVEIVSIPPEELTPMLIRDSNFISAFIYDFSEWFRIHGDSMTKTPNHDCPIYFAPILKEEPTQAESKVIKKAGFSDPFNLIEFNLSVVSKVSFLPMVFYSSALTAVKVVEGYNKELRKKLDEEAKKIDIPEDFFDEHFGDTP